MMLQQQYIRQQRMRIVGNAPDGKQGNAPDGQQKSSATEKDTDRMISNNGMAAANAQQQQQQQRNSQNPQSNRGMSNVGIYRNGGGPPSYQDPRTSGVAASNHHQQRSSQDIDDEIALRMEQHSNALNTAARSRSATERAFRTTPATSQKRATSNGRQRPATPSSVAQLFRAQGNGAQPERESKRNMKLSAAARNALGPMEDGRGMVRPHKDSSLLEVPARLRANAEKTSVSRAQRRQQELAALQTRLQQKPRRHSQDRQTSAAQGPKTPRGANAKTEAARIQPAAGIQTKDSHQAKLSSSKRREELQRQLRIQTERRKKEQQRSGKNARDARSTPTPNLAALARLQHRDVEYNQKQKTIHLQGPIEEHSGDYDRGANKDQGQRRSIWLLLLLSLLLILSGLALALVWQNSQTEGNEAKSIVEPSTGPPLPPSDDEAAPTVGATTAPVAAPTPDKTTIPNAWQRQVDQMIRRVTLNESVFDVAATPQAMALDWMLYKDLLDYSIVAERVIQRYALAVFYFATNAGKSWTKDDWLRGDECQDGEWYGLNCDENNKVRAIAFDDEGLSGLIPDEVGLLTELQNFIVKNHNDLRGPIPATIGNLSALKQLGLYGNNLSGSIPSDVTNAYGLRYINLENNRLSGSIPTTIERLTELETLVLSNNMLQGKFPTSQLSKTGVKHISLSNNRLIGGLDGSIQNFQSLQSLLVDNNQMIGTIPNEIGSVSTLTNLDLSHNELAGTMPETIGRLRRLKSLALNNNGLGGSLPRGMGVLVNLENMNLSANEFSGTIPNISNLAQLKYLYLSENRFTGTFPEAIQQLLNVEVIFLSSNKFGGQIPAGINRLSNSVRGLYLSDNKFIGAIPFALCDFFGLEALFLDANQLTGKVPTCLGQLSELRQLYLFDNSLSGQIPAEIEDMNKLNELGLERNDFTGNVPAGICNGNDIEIWADCNAQSDGGLSVQCSCCDVCCPSSGCT